MAPISEDIHALVQRLEDRVAQLEAKLHQAGGGSAPASSDGVRMILMGPPGAGTLSLVLATTQL